MSSTSTPVQVDNSTLYSTWANTYDHDSNVLQHLDTLLLTEILPILLTPAPARILDLGAGTARTSLNLLASPDLPQTTELLLVEPCEPMLEIAKEKVFAFSPRNAVTFRVGSVEEVELAEGAKPDLVVSTLVLEHVSLDAFWGGVKKVAKDGTRVYVTDMHTEMGSSRAGFRGEDGVKRVGESWNHGWEETVAAAETEGFRLIERWVRGVPDGGWGGKYGEETERRGRKWWGKKMLSAGLWVHQGA